MDFPTYNILLASQQDDEPGVLDDFSQGGLQHSRIVHNEIYSRFDLVYDMTWAQYKSLRAIYDAGPRDTYTNFVYHDVSPAEKYTVKFLARPHITNNDGNGRFTVAVSIRGTMD